jgi:hypothetical protein
VVPWLGHVRSPARASHRTGPPGPAHRRRPAGQARRGRAVPGPPGAVPAPPPPAAPVSRAARDSCPAATTAAPPGGRGRAVGRACFASLEAASAFFAAGSVGHSTTRDGARLDGLELRTLGWRIEPLDVQAIFSGYFSDASRFPPGSVAFDSALPMRNPRARVAPRQAATHPWRLLLTRAFLIERAHALKRMAEAEPMEQPVSPRYLADAFR